MTTTTISWTLSSGKEASVTVTADYGLTLTGHRYTYGKMHVETVAKVEGIGEVGRGGLKYGGNLPAGYTAVIGKLALAADKVAKIEAAIEAAKAVVDAHNSAMPKAAPMRSSRSMEIAMACGEL
jgi:hypothetical protein